jgi:aerobic-type carbon monoxide dehydrogenase small subunit (CoxS/CutS family)
MVASTLSPDATLDEIRVALAGNLCRCTGYEAIYRAIQKANEPARDLLLDRPQ